MNKTESVSATPSGKAIGGAVVGVAIGGAQVWALRSYMDKPGEPLFGKGGDYENWGQPSACVNLGVGIVAAGLGAVGYLKGIGIKSRPVAAALTGYGLTALAGGVYSGMNPVETTAPQRVPTRVPPQIPTQTRVPTMQATATATKGLKIEPAATNGGISVRSLAT